MDLHPGDIGKTKTTFQVTSAVLQMTLKICVGDPFPEKGMNRFNVYELNKKGDQVERLRGYYLVEKDFEDYNDKDGDFNIKEMGEPTWITPEGVPKEEKVSKRDYIVMEDTHSEDAFYDALLRAKSSDPTMKSTPDAIQAERRRVGGLFSGKEAMIVEMYTGLKEKVDKKELMRAGRAMKDIPEFAALYEGLSDAPDAKEKASEQLDTTDRAMFIEMDPTDVHPVSSLEQYTLIHYFNRNLDLKEKEASDTFVKCINEHAGVIPVVMKRVEEADKIQMIPMMKDGKGYKVMEFTPRSSVKYMMVEYTLPPEEATFKLISFQDKDIVHGLSTKEELPEEIRKQIPDAPDLPLEPDVSLDDSKKAEVSLDDSKKIPLEEVPVVDADPGIVEVNLDEDPTTGEPLNLTRKKGAPSPKPKDTRKNTNKDLTTVIAGIPRLSPSELTDEKLNEKDPTKLLQYMISNTEWGKYCSSHLVRSEAKLTRANIMRAAQEGSVNGVFLRKVILGEKI